MVSFKHRGNFNKIEKFFNRMTDETYLNKLAEYGKMGVDALSSATPVDSGLTASCWEYEIEHTDTMTVISWLNTNVNKNVNIALILQYGHGTGTGGYVQGRDYINPAIRPIFDAMASEAWKEVTEA